MSVIFISPIIYLFFYLLPIVEDSFTFNNSQKTINNRFRKFRIICTRGLMKYKGDIFFYNLFLEYYLENYSNDIFLDTFY